MLSAPLPPLPISRAIAPQNSLWRNFILALGPLLLSLALFRFSPPLAIAIQLFLLCALIGKLPFFLLATFAAIPFQLSLLGGESTSGANVSLVDVLAALLFLTLLCALPRRRTLVIGPVGLPISLYIGILCASSLANWEGFTTGISLVRMLMVTLVAILIFANFKTALVLAHRGYLIFLISLSVLAFFTVLAFVQGGVEASMYTFGINKNLLGPTFGCGILICLCYLLTDSQSKQRTLWLRVALAFSTIGCFLSLSRGAWLATTISFLALLLIIKNKRAFWSVLLLMIPLIAAMWQLLPQNAADYASNISTSATTIQSRFETINTVLTAFQSSPLMGVGIGLRKTVEPHNVLILTLGESGIIGLFGFLGMFAGGFYTFYLAYQRTADDLSHQQLVLIGISILLLSLIHGCVDVYWRRGIGFLGWAGVGLAVQILALHPAPSRSKSVVSVSRKRRARHPNRRLSRGRAAL